MTKDDEGVQETIGRVVSMSLEVGGQLIGEECQFPLFYFQNLYLICGLYDDNLHLIFEVIMTVNKNSD